MAKRNSKEEGDLFYRLVIIVISGLILFLFIFSLRSFKTSKDEGLEKSSTGQEESSQKKEDISLSDYFENQEDFSSESGLGPDPFKKTCAQAEESSEKPTFISNTICIR